MKTVAILGTGPAGLVAAHACKLAGVPFHLFGMGQKSMLGGAQFLHHQIPGLCGDEPDFHIKYHVVGDRRTYQRKVYGNAEVPFVSFANVSDGELQPAWALDKLYDGLWNEIAGGGSSINAMNVTPEILVQWIEAGTFDVIVSTIPKKELCLSANGLIVSAHHFWSQEVRVMQECIFETNMAPNTIMYDGTPNVSWYRTALINGVGSTEWGSGAPEKLPYDTFTLRKPVRTTCTCFEGEVVFTGRHGAWKKGNLVHHAFVDTWKAVMG